MTEQERLEREAKELDILKRNSPAALPDNPTAAGWTPSQIKEKFSAGLLYLYTLLKNERNLKDEEIAASLESIGKLEIDFNNELGNLKNSINENIDVVEVLNQSIVGKADKTYVDDLFKTLNLYDYTYTTNPYVEGAVLYLENVSVEGNTLKIKNGSVENNTLYL